MPVVLQLPQLRLSVADETQSVGHYGMYLKAGASVAQGRAALAQLRAALPTDCVPVGGHVKIEALELDPADGAGDALICGVFVFETVQPGQLAVISVPGLRPHLVDAADLDLVDLTNPDIVAFIDALQTGNYCNPFGYALTTCIAAMVQIRKLR